MSTVEISQADNGKSIRLSRGQTLLIHLPENPTTGYRWEVDTVDSAGREANAQIITLESTTYTPGPSTGVGGSGTRTFVYKALNVGTTQLRLKHWQPWEGDRSVDKRYSLTVQVNGD